MLPSNSLCWSFWEQQCIWKELHMSWWSATFGHIGGQSFWHLLLHLKGRNKSMEDSTKGDWNLFYWAHTTSSQTAIYRLLNWLKGAVWVKSTTITLQVQHDEYTWCQRSHSSHNTISLVHKQSTLQHYLGVDVKLDVFGCEHAVHQAFIPLLYFAVGWASAWSLFVFSTAGEAVCLSSGHTSGDRHRQLVRKMLCERKTTASKHSELKWPVSAKWYSGRNLRHSACFLKVCNSAASSAPVRALKEQPWHRWVRWGEKRQGTEDRTWK